MVTGRRALTALALCTSIAVTAAFALHGAAPTSPSGARSPSRGAPWASRARRERATESFALPGFVERRMAAAARDPRYTVSAGATLSVAHPTLPLEGHFDDEGIALRHEDVQTRLDFAGVRRGEHRHVAASRVRPQARDNRVRYARSADVEEWWVHGRDGLEQGFTLATRPTGEGAPVTVELEVTGGARPEADGERVLLRDMRGEVAFVVSELAAFDADGRTLDARFEVSGARLAIHVVDAGARYPIVIDPLVAPTRTTTPSGAQANAFFGHALATTVSAAAKEISLVGAPRYNGVAPGVGAVYAFERTGTQYTQTQRIDAPEGVANDSFGATLAVTSRWALIGASDADIGALTDAGAVYVYEAVNGRWEFRRKLTAATPTASARFGWGLAGDGSSVAVGAPGTTVSGVANAGRVELFELADDATFVRTRIVSPIAPTAHTRFGLGLALSPTRLVIGAPGADESHGEAYVYRRDGQALTRTDTLRPGTIDYASFGSTVALTESRVVVGAPVEDQFEGAVYVFEGAEGALAMARRYVAPGGVGASGFGNALAVQDTRVAVGAPYYSATAGQSVGAVFVFDVEAPDLLPDETLGLVDAADGDQYGFSVALRGETVLAGAARRDAGARVDSGSLHASFIDGTGYNDGRSFMPTLNESALYGAAVSVSGDLAVVGAPFRSVGGVTPGALYPYVRTNGTWRSLPRIDLPDPSANAKFGASLAQSGTVVVVGASSAEVGAATYAGRAYVFEYDGAAFRLVASLTSPTPRASGEFGADVTVDGDVVVVGEPSCLHGGVVGGCVHVFDRADGAWTRRATLGASTPQAGARFGRSVSLSGSALVVGSPGRDAANDGTPEGNVYAFAANANGTFAATALLVPSATTTRELGTDVSVRGVVLVATAPASRVGNSVDVGAAFVYRWTGTSWGLAATVANPRSAAYSRFGSSVAQLGDQIVIGAQDADLGGLQDTGAAYVVRRVGSSYFLNTHLSIPVPQASDRFGFALATGTNELFVGAASRRVSGLPLNGAVHTFLAR